MRTGNHDTALCRYIYFEAAAATSGAFNINWNLIIFVFEGHVGEILIISTVVGCGGLTG